MKRPTKRPTTATADPVPVRQETTPTGTTPTADPSARQKSPLTAFSGTGGTTDRPDPVTTATGTETTRRANVVQLARLTRPDGHNVSPSAVRPTGTADPDRPRPVPVRQEYPHIYRSVRVIASL